MSLGEVERKGLVLLCLVRPWRDCSWTRFSATWRWGAQPRLAVFEYNAAFNGRGAPRERAVAHESCCPSTLFLVHSQRFPSAFNLLCCSSPTSCTAACFVLCLSTLLLGLALIVLGRLRLASLVQYLPMPVIGGYLAFIGYFCGQAGLAFASGVRPPLSKTAHAYYKLAHSSLVSSSIAVRHSMAYLVFDGGMFLKERLLYIIGLFGRKRSFPYLPRLLNARMIRYFFTMEYC